MPEIEIAKEAISPFAEYGGLVMSLVLANLVQGWWNMRLTARLNELTDSALRIIPQNSEAITKLTTLVESLKKDH